MNKKLVVLVLLIFALVIGFASMSFAETQSITVNQTSAKVIVNGVLTNFEAYVIEGNNYFKLRDIAMVVRGTKKQFGVTWDGAKSAINLVSNSSYTSVGGELAAGDGNPKQAILNTSVIYKDGVLVKLTAYTIGGNNFFKLRDLTQAFNIGVTWDGATSTVGIDTNLSYVIPQEVISQEVIPQVPGYWYTLNYPFEFTNSVSYASEGYFVGQRLPDMYSDDATLAIYNIIMKPIALTKYKIGSTYTSGFHDGLMAVTLGAKYKYTNAKGQLVDAQTWATVGEAYGYMDTSGREVIPLKYFDVSDFKNGVAIVHHYRGTQVYTSVIDKNEKILFEFKELLYGEIADNYIFFDDDSGRCYDYSGKFLRYGEAPSLITKGDTSGDQGNFAAKYGKLYDKYEHVGKGFFFVEELRPKISIYDDFDAWEAQQLTPLKTGVVDKNNNPVVPMGVYGNKVALDTNTSKFFIIEEDGSTNVYIANGNKLVSDVIYAAFAGEEAVYYHKRDSEGMENWGIISTDGTYIVPNTRTYLLCFDFKKGDIYGNEEGEHRKHNIVAYTTIDFTEKADTTQLRLLVNKANELFSNELLTFDDSYFDQVWLQDYRDTIAGANRVLASSNPIWIDTSPLEVQLLWFLRDFDLRIMSALENE